MEPYDENLRKVSQLIQILKLVDKDFSSMISMIKI